MFTRSQTRAMTIGPLPLGGGAPVSVQTMATADPHDAAALTAQIARCAAAGADLVRLTVPDVEAARVLGAVRRASPVPLVADIHFDHRCALAALEAGVDALRLNPGNIGGPAHVKAVAQAARARHTPIRVGVNGGSLERDLLAKYGAPTAEALVESALRHVALLEAEGVRDIVISVKASDVPRTLAAYRLLAEKTDCPLHLGVTEAGTVVPGTVRSSVALGVLLGEGLGDTLRVSLTAAPEREVKVGLEILRAVGLRAPGPAITSCPTCGRTQVDLFAVAEQIETALESLYRSNSPLPTTNSPLPTTNSQLPTPNSFPHVAVMGCVVNGPGEAKGADIALCGGAHEFLLFVDGRNVGRVAPEAAVEAVLDAAKNWMRTHAK